MKYFRCTHSTEQLESQRQKQAITSPKVDCKYSVYFWSKVLNTYQIAHLDILLRFYHEIWKRSTLQVIFTEHRNTVNLGGFHHGAHSAPWKMSNIEDSGKYNFCHIVPTKLPGMPDAEFTIVKWNSCHIVPAYLSQVTWLSQTLVRSIIPNKHCNTDNSQESKITVLWGLLHVDAPYTKNSWPIMTPSTWWTLELKKSGMWPQWSYTNAGTLHILDSTSMAIMIHLSKRIAHKQNR